MRQFLHAGMVLLALLGLSTASFIVTSEVSAQQKTACEINPSSDLCESEQNANTSDYRVVIRNVVNTLLYIVGVAAVVVIIISGLRYVTSGGNQTSVQSAKTSLIYAVVGLLVAIFAYAIVNLTLQGTTGSL